MNHHVVQMCLVHRYVNLKVLKMLNTVYFKSLPMLAVWHSVASVCLFIHALKGKRLEISALKSVDVIHGGTSACTDLEVKRSQVKA